MKKIFSDLFIIIIWFFCTLLSLFIENNLPLIVLCFVETSIIIYRKYKRGEKIIPHKSPEERIMYEKSPKIFYMYRIIQLIIEIVLVSFFGKLVGYRHIIVVILVFICHDLTYKIAFDNDYTIHAQ